MRPHLAVLFACAACARPGAGLNPQPAPAELDLPPVACGPVPREVARISDPRLDEISGVAEGRRHPELLFVHNDSGDSPRFFAIDRRGRFVAELRLPTVPKLLDAEELALGPGPNGASFIYLGDTGNNFASAGLGIPRRKAVIHRIPEPDVPPSARGLELAIEDVFPIVLTFPDGARDVEAFFIEPTTGELYMLSKEPDGDSQVLTASAAVLAGGGGELRLSGRIQLGSPSLLGSTLATAASISRDGRLILVRTYATVLLFRRAPGESVMSALARRPEQLQSPDERQGEAISFVDGDAAFLTISEGEQRPIYCGLLPAPSENHQ